MSSIDIPLEAYLTIAAALFCIGVWGLINSRNAVRVLMSIELMLNGVNINLMAFSSYLDGTEIRGQVYAIFVITVAAAEAAVGLAILLSLYRNRDTVDMERFYLPGTASMNIVLHDVLGGGGIASLRTDTQGKSYAEILLDTAIEVPG